MCKLQIANQQVYSWKCTHCCLEIIINDLQGTLLKWLNSIALFSVQQSDLSAMQDTQTLQQVLYHRLVEAEQVTGWHPSSLQLLKKVQPFVQLGADICEMLVPFQWLANCNSEHLVLCHAVDCQIANVELIWRVACQRPKNLFLCLSGADVHFVVRRPWYQLYHSRLNLTGLKFLDNFSDSCIIHKLMCNHSQFQVICHDKKHQRTKPVCLRHSSSHRELWSSPKNTHQRLSTDTCCRGRSWSDQWWRLAVVTF